MIKRKAFTLFELVMVIIVFGIVASIASDIIASLYKNFLTTSAVNKLESQTALTLEQLSKRLQYRIKDSVRVYSTDNSGYITSNASSITDTNSSHNAIEWIGYSNESFLGGWSGFIDLAHTDTNKSSNTLKTSDSNLSYANIIIKALTFDDVSLDGTQKLPALMFKGQKTPFYINGYYDGNYTLKVKRFDDDTLTFTEGVDNNITDFDNDGFSDIFEQYYLAHSAFAIVPIGSENDFNLTLIYNYQPWEGENFEDNGTRNVLAEHVSTFRFLQEGSSLRLKLCINDNNKTTSFNFSACKEEVIY